MKKRIFISIQYMEIGGAERALLGLLNAIDYSKFDVDLFIHRHIGEFMSFIPSRVNILPEIKKYTTLTRPVKDILKEGYIDIAIARIMAFLKERKNAGKKIESIAIYQYVANYTTPLLPSLKMFGEYDLAISFLIPHNIVLEKVNAKKKVAWIHTDYSYVSVDVENELPIWNRYDNIISISESVSESFLKIFPSLKNKIVLIENILSESFITTQSLLKHDNVMNDAKIKLCTVGRFSFPKGIDRAVFICRSLIEKGLNIRWYIVGYGVDEELIKSNITKAGMEKYFILLGKKTNPYPYIKECDIYIQPSRYEGKAVTVREAQILGKPVVITNFPTSRSQLLNDIDGIIVPDNIEEAANELANFINNSAKKSRIEKYVRTHHYGNEEEINKIYQLI